MANTQLGSIDLDFTNARKTTPGAGADITTPANYASITAMRARLTAISGTTYSSANLDVMSVNDMIYALRVNDDATSIVQ